MVRPLDLLIRESPHPYYLYLAFNIRSTQTIVYIPVNLSDNFDCLLNLLVW